MEQGATGIIRWDRSRSHPHPTKEEDRAPGLRFVEDDDLEMEEVRVRREAVERGGKMVGVRPCVEV